jgi:hypothetical protein
MEAYRVFVSSIMNRSLEDLVAEREAARSAVEHFGRMTVAWAFEAEPASPMPLLDFYLGAVKTSDLFVLIVGQHLTKPVKDEYDVARDHGKPMLVFCKTVPSQDPEVDELLRSLNAKWESFVNAAELREKIRKALGLHLLSLVRHQDENAIRHGDRIAMLRSYVKTRRELRVHPTVPQNHYNSFTVQTVDGSTVVFRKANGEDVTVPTQRIEDVLETTPPEPASVQLNGRLQWLTLRERWGFFSDKPPSPDPLCIGFGKQVPSGGEFINRIAAQLRDAGYSYRWSNPVNVPNADVFFDEDGLHLTNGSQILVCQRRGQSVR